MTEDHADNSGIEMHLVISSVIACPDDAALSTNANTARILQSTGGWGVEKQVPPALITITRITSQRKWQVGCTRGYTGWRDSLVVSVLD